MARSQRYNVFRYRLWQIYTAPYFAYKNAPALWRFRNREQFKNFKGYRQQIRDGELEIVRQLEADGLALSSLETFFPDDPDILNRLKKAADASIAIGAKKANAKEFLRYFFRSDREQVDYGHAFMSLSLHVPFLEIVSAYFQTFARLEYVTGNIALPTGGERDPQASQKWHRDPGVYKNCKIFVYLTDVDEQAGPFTYVRGTQPGGPLSRIARHPFFGQGSYYPRASVVTKAFADKNVAQKIFPAHGKAGTIIFANTMGMHRGGYAIDRERHMLTFYYRPIHRGRPLREVFFNPPETETIPRIVYEALSPTGRSRNESAEIDPIA